MYLKSLTVLGFKSFADKTTFNFLPGITAVVGPNGCGKSNVADSIRWVLGEQSAKALRGGEMADVIFNGSDRRKAMGMAEVSLTITDVDREHLTAAGVELTYNEVTLTRRIFRDGVSEYFINKTPCRLKDIQQLFMGTGVGRTSYSIMAQGHITQLLSSRPEDRRQVFEEAAGITKFKAQKREALRKLESTEQNLLRVGDLIREVKRQIGSLQRQAGKARRYKQLMQELQHVETQLARHQFDVLEVEIRERQLASERMRGQIEECSEAIMRGEAEVGQLRHQGTDLEHRIGEAQRRSLELKSQADWHGSRIHFNGERLRELEKQNAAALNDIAQAEERRQAAETELTAVSTRHSESTQAVTQLRQTLQVKTDNLRELEEEMRQGQEALRDAQAGAFANAQQLTRLRNEVTALDLQKHGDSARLEKLSSEKIQLEEERLRLQTRLRDFAASVESERLQAQARRGTLEEQQQQALGLQHQLSQVGQELDQVLQRQSGERSRLQVLEQLQADYEGFSAGPLAALKQAPQLLGALVDKIQVPDEHVIGIEAALGHHLQLVLTETPDAAYRILEDLATRRQGRASVAALSLTGPANEGAAQGDPSALVPYPSALAVITCDPTARPLLERLLGRTRLVPDLGAATALWQEHPGQYDLVTRSGELLSAQGVYTGGVSQGSGRDPGSILGRKNQIAELQTQLGQLQEQVASLSRRKGTLQSEATALQASLHQAQSDLRTREVAIATHQGEQRALENALRLLEQKIETVVYEVQNLAAREQENADKRQQLLIQVRDLDAQDQSVQQQLGQIHASLEQLRHRREAAQQGLGETKVALATQEQLARSFQQQCQSHQNRLAEIAQWVEQRRKDIASQLDRRTQFESEIAESQSRIESLQHERDQVNAQTAELQHDKDLLDGDIDTRETTLREQRGRHTALQEQRGGLEVELAQKNMAVDNLRERIQQKYQVRLDDVRSECITITFADSGPARIQTLTPEEMAAQGIATDWGAVAEQVVALQQRVDEMGPVNLVAIEEYEEAEQRYQFLTTQNDDLLKAKDQLLEVIHRINSQTREMFAETFARVRENFRALFAEVFRGGTADLSLVDEHDVLESGIEITARPPGKQLRSISLLSGGEQTMTAVALLFAIYQVKPSPFCVLDELDAPLDESNISRFIAVLRRFLAHSQFIIITHNKATIATADVLYGITMQEKGVSKLISVKFRRGGRETGPDVNQEISEARVDAPLSLPRSMASPPHDIPATPPQPPPPEAGSDTAEDAYEVVAAK
jgi:chromosome segregation protein